MAQERTLDVGELIEGRKPGAAQIGVALLLCTLMLLEGYDMQTLSFAAPAILQEWGVSRAEFGYVLTGHLLGYLVGAVFLTFLLQLAVIYIPALNPIFKTTPLTAQELAISLLLPAIVLVMVEFEKVFIRSGLLYAERPGAQRPVHAT